MLNAGRTNVRVLIVDDEELGRRVVRSLLAADSDIEIIGESVSALDARRKISDLQPDLVFLDLGLPGGSGIEMWRNLSEPLPYLVIVTGHSEFALQAFDLQADDYLVKPILRQRFARSLLRAKRRIAERRVAGFAMQIAGAAVYMNGDGSISTHALSTQYPNQLTIRVRRRMFSIDVNDIVWIQGASQYSRVHTKTSEFLLSRTLASLECELDPVRFFRVHRSAIVNAAHVSEVRSRGDGCYNIYLQGGQALPMGRARREILGKLLSSIGSQNYRAFDLPDQSTPVSVGVDA